MRLEDTLKQLADQLVPKQQALDFTRPEHWQQLSRADQQACRDAIAKLLCQVVNQRQEDEHE